MDHMRISGTETSSVIGPLSGIQTYDHRVVPFT